MSDERQQSLALLVFNLCFAMWISHYVVEAFPGISGALNLQHWILFWNKPIWIHWPIAFVLFAGLHLLFHKLRKLLTLASLRKQKDEASNLKGNLNPDASQSYDRIL